MSVTRLTDCIFCVPIYSDIFGLFPYHFNVTQHSVGVYFVRVLLAIRLIVYI